MKSFKSRFIEMFGNPLTFKNINDSLMLGDVCEFYSGTGFPTMYQGSSDGTFPFYKVGDISSNVLRGYSRLTFCENYVDRDVVNKIKGTIIPRDTVVFAKIGEAIRLNRRAITSEDCLVDNNVVGIKPDPNKLNILYFFEFMKYTDLYELASATTVPSLRKSVLEKIKIKVPPIELQNQFADFAKQVDKSKFILEVMLNYTRCRLNNMLDHTTRYRFKISIPYRNSRGKYGQLRFPKQLSAVQDVRRRSD